MANYVKSDEFIEVALECNLDPREIQKTLKESYPDYTVSTTQIRKRIANYRRNGKIPLDSGNEISIGEVLKGTSTLYGPDNEIIQQWVKTDVPKQQTLEAFQEALEHIVRQVEPRQPIPFSNVIGPDEQDLLTVYPIGDAHVGMLAWKPESGADNDLHTITDVHNKAIKAAVEQALPTENAFIVDTGDWFHSDNNENRTSRGNNALDVDGRYPKVLRAGLELAASMIEHALVKHKKVHWRSAIGNHNEHSSTVINYYLEAYFRNEPRVIIHTNPSMFYYYQFGEVLLGITHGHTCKPDKLGELMAVDCADIWSSTKHRYWLLGHVHHQSLKEYPSCVVETFRTLSGKDAWHASMGYRSGQDLKTITYHRKYGEIARSTLNIAAVS